MILSMLGQAQPKYRELSGFMTDDEIKTIIKETIKETMQECVPQCPLTNIQANFTHWEQSIETIGAGSFDAGIERIRKNHEYTSSLRKLQTKIGGYVLNVIVVSIVGGIIAALYFGITGKKIT